MDNHTLSALVKSLSGRRDESGRPQWRLTREREMGMKLGKWAETQGGRVQFHRTLRAGRVHTLFLEALEGC